MSDAKFLRVLDSDKKPIPDFWVMGIASNPLMGFDNYIHVMHKPSASLEDVSKLTTLYVSLGSGCIVLVAKECAYIGTEPVGGSLGALKSTFSVKRWAYDQNPS